MNVFYYFIFIEHTKNIYKNQSDGSDDPFSDNRKKCYKIKANEIEKRDEAFLIYQDENGIARVNVRFEGEDVWLTVEQIMELFDASQQDVSYHIKQIYADGEQDAERTHKKFLLVRQEGNRSVRRNMSHYNLDMIIAE